LGGAWSPDGTSIVFSVLRQGIYEVPAQGGTPRLIVKVDLERWGDHFESPWFLPAAGGSRVLLYTAQTRERAHVTVVHSLETGKQEVVAPSGLGVYSPTGHVMYVRQSLLWALPFSLKAMTATGEAFPVARTGWLRSVGVSLDGTLAYLEHEWRQQLTWRDRDGRKSVALEVPNRWILMLSLSPDGRSAAVASWGDDYRSAIWLHDLARGTKMRLTSEPSANGNPIWHPSENIVTFVSYRRGNGDIFARPADGSGTERPLVATPLDEHPFDWSPDGRCLVYRVVDPKGGSDLWYLKKKDDGSGYESAPFLQTPFGETEAAFSPDGGFLAYVSGESGRGEVYVQRFPEGGGRRQVSVNGGIQPRWRKDGRELFYSEGETLMAVPVTIGSTFSAGVPRPLFKALGLLREPGEQGQRYDVSADGRRFLLAEPVDEAAEPVIRVVRNWFTEFRDRQPDGR
jgi:Tol biopolymer transport system component